MKNEMDLKNAIVKHVGQEWRQGRILLTSHLGHLLRDDEIVPSEIIIGKSVTNFIRESVPEVEVVKHPSQRAKIALIPKGEKYSFESEVVESVDIEDDHSDTLKKSRGAFYAFVREISRLPASEIDKVNIPFSIVVKLLEGK